jgi:hypothetical protein
MPQHALPEPVFHGTKLRAAPRRLRDLWAIDERDEIVRRAQTHAGRVVLVALFALAAWFAGVHPLPVAVATAFAYLPRYRSWIALAAALAALCLNLDGKVALDAIGAILLKEGLDGQSALAWGLATTAAWLCGCGALLALVRRNRIMLVARRPVPSLLGAMLVLGALASMPWLAATLRAALWSLLIVFAAFIWFLAYALVDQRSRAPAALAFQVGILHPFWGSSATPFGKGAAFLRKHQASDDVELAVTQLKGLKLLAWSLWLILVAGILDEVVQVLLGVPEPQVVYEAYRLGHRHPLPLMWSSLAWETFGGVLSLAIWGHGIVAVARLAGFRLPRNTWRPLQSRSLAEFWNRYYYYFKELMVEFFFMPTFLRTFRRHPRLRVFFATFMAAGVGNAIYHFIRDVERVALLGPHQSLEGFTSYLLYCFLLALGIGISQARMSAGRKLPASLPGMLWSGMCVWGFFICLQVFADESRILSLQERLAFFVSLFGYR